MQIKTVYLLLAITGGIIPFVFFGQHFAAVGFGLLDFVAAVTANPAASGFTADLVMCSLVFWIAMLHRRSRGEGPKPALFIMLTLFIGLSCALPAYLYASTASQD